VRVIFTNGEIVRPFNPHDFRAVSERMKIELGLKGAEHRPQRARRAA
jgi:hypothetical protein